MQATAFVSTHWIENTILQSEVLTYNKARQQHFKNYKAKLYEAEATTVMRPRPVFEPRGQSRDEA